MRNLTLMVVGFALMFAAGEIALADAPPEFETISAQVMTPAENPETGEIRFFPTPADVPAGWLALDPSLPPRVVPISAGPEILPISVEADGSDDGFCAQVIAYGQNPNTGEWEMFPTPCDVPAGWRSSLSPPEDMDNMDRPMPVEPDGGIGDGTFCIQVVTWGQDPATGVWRAFPTPCDVPDGWASAGVPPEGAPVDEPSVAPGPDGGEIALEPYVDPETGEIMFPEGMDDAGFDIFGLAAHPEVDARIGAGSLRIAAGKDGLAADPILTYGDALSVKIGVDAGLAGVYDLYVALEEPDGTLTYLHHEGAAERMNRPERYYAPVFMFFRTTAVRFSPEPAAAAPAWEARPLRPTPVFSSAIFPGTPAGTYTAWAILTGPGESPQDPANWREADRARFIIE